MSMLSACVITLVLETGFFALLGYRKGWFPALCACVNAASNLTLNILLLHLPYTPWVVYPLELCVVAVEYGVFAMAMGRSKRLFRLTAAANVLSYCIGGIIFGFVG